MATGIVWDERFAWHHTGNVLAGGPSAALEPLPHPDTPESKRRIRNLLEVSGLLTQLVPIAAESAGEDDLRRVHTRAHLDRVFRVSESGGGEVGSRTAIGSGGAAIATLAAGGGIAAVRAVCEGRVRNAYALLRPAGHHAESDKALGFCIFANAAIAGRYAQAQGLAERIAFVDWDVHHGNGTEAIFWTDPSALTISIHQDMGLPWKPGSGAMADRGGGAGTGFNLNVPLPPGSGAGAYQAVLERVVVPALEKFRPDLIIVPSGLDAGFQDPLARMMLHSAAYRAMTRTMMDVAELLCGGRLVLLHEGGYAAATVPYYGLAIFETLSGIRTWVADPFVDYAAAWPGQALQPHQDAVVRAATDLVEGWRPAL
jgi:acetoin utilization deacetylase AcuC-like enzyme